MNKREIEQAISEEVAEWDGVSVEFVAGGKHPKAKLTFGDQSLFRAYGGNQSATAYPHRTIADMRDTMEQLGATRKAAPPTKAEADKRQRERNEAGVKARPDPVKREPIKAHPDIADQLVDAGVISVADREAIWTTDGFQVSESNHMTTAEYKTMGQRTFERMSEAQDDEDAQRARELAEFEAKVAAVADGIHFGLDEKVYHAVRALGSSSINDLIVGPATFWRGSWLDPNRPEFDADATDAQQTGKAKHCALFEPDQLEMRFARKPAIEDFPKRNFVKNGTEIEAALADLGEPKKIAGEKVADQAERLEYEGFEGTIWPLIEARFKRGLGDRTAIAGVVWDEMMIDVDRVHANEDIAPMLAEGAAEVSVIWTDQHGIRCKARLDKLRPDLWADYKSFDNPKRKVVDQAIYDAMRYDRYYIQAVHYRDAIEAIRVGGLQIVGAATDAERALIAAIHLRPEELQCWYIFQQKKGVPNLLAKRFKFHAIDHSREHDARALVKGEKLESTLQTLRQTTALHRLARLEIDKAKRDFVLYSQTYPTGEPWSPIECLGTIGDEDFSDFWLSGL